MAMAAPPPPPGAPPPAGAARRLPVRPLNAPTYRPPSTFVNFRRLKACARAHPREHQADGCAADVHAQEQGIDSVHAHAYANFERVRSHTQKSSIFRRVHRRLHARHHARTMCMCVHATCMHFGEQYILHARMYSPGPGRPGRPAARTGGDEASGLSSAQL